MTNISFALNHMTAPRLTTAEFIDLAADLGCTGIELRNDLADKKLTDRPFFDDMTPTEIGVMVRARGLRLLGLSEAYGFNRWDHVMRDKVVTLARQARDSGAETINLIPSNDGKHGPKSENMREFQASLLEIKSILSDFGIIGLIEPLGFSTSSLRHKADAIELIDSIDGQAHFRLVHDTFHHHLAGETDFYPEMTGIVHISGVVDPALEIMQMQDEHRILVDENDRLGNCTQISHLLATGYGGAFSYEPFSPLIHAASDLQSRLHASMAFIAEALH